MICLLLMIYVPVRTYQGERDVHSFLVNKNLWILYKQQIHIQGLIQKLWQMGCWHREGSPSRIKRVSELSDKKQRSLCPGSSCVAVRSPSLVSATPWTAAGQAPLSFTVSRSSLKLVSVESAMLSNHLILCHVGAQTSNA